MSSGHVKLEFSQMPQNVSCERTIATEMAAPLRAATEIRVAEIEAFANAIMDPSFMDQLANREIFAGALDLAISEYGVSQKDLADLLQQSSAQVGRWKAGTSAPSVRSREQVIDLTARLLSGRVAELRARSVSRFVKSDTTNLSLQMDTSREREHS